MSEFKNPDEYQKWKSEKVKQTQQNEDKPQKIKNDQMRARPYAENKFTKKKLVLLIAVPFIVLIPIIYFLSFYMTHGHLSGNVFLTTQSGDTKKAAGIEVYLLKIEDPDSTAKKISEINHDYAGRILSEKLDAKYAYEDYEHYKPVQDTAEKYHNKWREHINQSNNLIVERNDKIRDLLFSHLLKKTSTDVNGYYKFMDIRHGKYSIFTTYSVFPTHWLCPVEINNRENKIDLTNSNMSEGDIFLSTE